MNEAEIPVSTFMKRRHHAISDCAGKVCLNTPQLVELYSTIFHNSDERALIINVA